ncbi:MAG: ergothioneine biosynthesis protein EgtB [Gammaproteobacteria bacterium]|nr:ergothioneine biosynthesis protein EgtB [Gammaproteobacteria bacterium]
MKLLAAFKPRLSEHLDKATLQDRFRAVRGLTEALCQSLADDDYQIQSMPDVSPPKWHLAHTGWFFENFLLICFLPRYPLFDPRFGYLFNSYYETVGSFHPRPQRGLLSRPTVTEVYRYRSHVDQHVYRLIESASAEEWKTISSLLDLGLNHEQQHQELLLTDIKYNFACNPLRPAYQAPTPAGVITAAPPLQWRDYEGGLYRIGHSGEEFAFDNERPRHRVYLENYRLASRPVTNGEYIEFIEAGGYQRPEYWLSDGWRAVQSQIWAAPLYWVRDGGRWQVMTLSGMREMAGHEPVCHVSYYEADAYARWAGKRLPAEAEWEHAAARLSVEGNFLESGRLHPASAGMDTQSPAQMYGDVWEWTQSPYTAYPGYRPETGALGEYNGKFMCSQIVLRGGSCASSAAHLRATYRNFFPPEARWQFSGLRLAEDAG